MPTRKGVGPREKLLSGQQICAAGPDRVYCASGFFSTRSITAVSTVPTTSATR
jgi:hypothetical protein